jgi:hypothetical protein
MSEAYDHLIDSLNMRGGSVAAHKCDELYALLEEIFTTDEPDRQMPPRNHRELMTSMIASME